MTRLILAALLAPLAACSQEPVANESNATVVVAEASGALGSVDLSKPIRGSGSEPFWGIDIRGNQITYTDASVDNPRPEAFAPAAPSVDVMAATYTTTNAKGEPVSVILSPLNCEGPAGPEKPFPLTITLKIGTQTREGCAGPAE